MASSSESTYRKIPKISPGAYIFQRTFLRGLFLEGAYYRREIYVSKLAGLIIVTLKGHRIAALRSD